MKNLYTFEVGEPLLKFDVPSQTLTFEVGEPVLDFDVPGVPQKFIKTYVVHLGNPVVHLGDRIFVLVPV